MSEVIEAFPPVRETRLPELTPAQREVFIDTLLSNAKTPRHAPTVMVEQRWRNGEVLYKPRNPHAEGFALIGKRPDKMLTAGDVEIIKTRFGYNIEFVAGRP